MEKLARSNYYDSDQPRRVFVSEITNLRRYRGLLRLLVQRDLTVRYKRSMLGVWWTLLNPLLTVAVMWAVFSTIFRFEIPGGVPYVVYVLSGVMLITFFSQGVVASGSSIVGSAGTLSKVYVPAEVFAVAPALAALVNFAINIVLLLAVQLIAGVGIPVTVLLAPVPLLFLAMFVAGLGMVVASLAVAYRDVLDIVGVLLTLAMYATPGFYPVTIVPDRILPLIYINPLYSYLEVFRGLVYGDSFAPGWMWAVMILTSLVALLGGAWTFSRSWRRLAVLV
ncbi:MAG: ABC transporter permease [Acidimicrobiia bacterium]|nr:ABC transporter permease [Acidimicrobiia bacterium]MYK55139.1 ABC transporter permease [Acidimicrobiia bacterium]